MRPATLAGMNVALGAGVAGVHAWWAGRPLGAALWRGALGGSVMAGGFTVSMSHADIARLASGQLVAFGASMARNAGDGTPMLSRLTFPLSPLIVERQRDSSGRGSWRTRVSAGALVGLAARGASRQGMQLDRRSTLMTGALVFRTSSPAFTVGVNCPPDVSCVRAGNENLGTIAYAANRSAAERSETLRHESVHLAQRSRDLILLGAPLGDWVSARGGVVGRGMGRLFVLDGMMPLDLADQLSSRWRGAYQGWYEREARTVAPGSAASFRSSSAR